MSTPLRPALLLAALCVLVCVTGCTAQSSGIGLAKVTFQRTTIPAGKTVDSGGSDGSSDSGGVPIGNPDDAAFTAAKLRLINPCALLDDDTLAPLGTPGDADPLGFGECSNDMADSGGNDLDVTVTLGDELSVDKATTTVDGMPVSEERQDSDCAERIITQTDPVLAVTVDVDYDDHDACTPARKLIDPIIHRIRLDPPLLTGADTTLVSIDPCTVVDDATAAAAVGAGPDKSLEGLYKCDWETDDLEVSVAFTVDSAPGSDDTEGKPEPVSLGGISAFQTLDTDVFPSCEVTWAVRPAAGQDDEDEQVDVEFDNIENHSVDSCAKAVAVAEVAAAKLPKPTN